MSRDEFGRTAVAQELAPPAQPVPAETQRNTLREWTARQRTTAVEALRYSRFVMVMKRALPLAAVVVLVSVFAYSVIPRRQDQVSLTTQRVGNISNDLTMTKPRLTGTDAQGNPFTITAALAVQDPKNRHRAELKQVDADMQVGGSDWLNASASLGFFDMDAGTLTLSGGISLYTDSGYELHTPAADVLIKKNVVEGQQKVTGHGPLGSLSADRFHFDRLKRQLKLDGHVHMVMYPKEAKRRR
jgi:lipopolysaccharide export system protein LptC